MAFVVKSKRIGLDEIGEDWKGGYLDFNSPLIGEIRAFGRLPESEQGAAGMDAMARAFIGGKGFDGKKLVDIKQSQFDELPYDVLAYANQIFTGTVSPNSPSV